MICQRCTKDVSVNPTHTCNPTPLVLRLEQRIAELEARITCYRANRYGNTPTPDDDPQFVAALRREGK